MWTALIIIIIALSVVTLYLFCIAPGRGRGNLLVNFEKMMIAHRGLFNTEEAPENSLAAFKLAIEKGYAIELDTQVSSDGEVVVFHDATLNRMCGFGKDAANGAGVPENGRKKRLVNPWQGRKQRSNRTITGAIL